MSRKILIMVLLILNAIVLLGQLLPEEAPPFANIVNIVFLSLSFLYFLLQLIKKK